MPDVNQQLTKAPKRPETYRLEVLQQPTMAKAANGKDKGTPLFPFYLRYIIYLLEADRKPVDPPPILQLHVPSDEDPDGVYRQSG